MIKKILTGAALSSMVLAIACAPKATNSNSTNSNMSNSNTTASKGNSNAPAGKKETKLPDAKKPAPVPADWVKMADEAKGYEFMVPAGTKDTSQTTNGVDVYLASVPAPYEIGVMVMAFKEKSMTKDDLVKTTTATLEAMGEKDIKIEAMTELNEDYSVATFTSTGADGKKGKGKFLVATDVTDNYIMLVGGDEAKFADNEKTIDAIWGSFAMYSGGASGNS